MFFASFLALVIFTLVGFFIMIVWISAMASSDKVHVGSKAVLVVDLSVPYQEQMPQSKQQQNPESSQQKSDWLWIPLCLNRNPGAEAEAEQVKRSEFENPCHGCGDEIRRWVENV